MLEGPKSWRSQCGDSYPSLKHHKGGQQSCYSTFFLMTTHAHNRQSHLSISNPKEGCRYNSCRLPPDIMHPDLISLQQTAFITNRQISNNVSLTQKFLIGFNVKTTPRRDVNRLLKSLQHAKMGRNRCCIGMPSIDATFRELVQACLRYMVLSTLIEGSPRSNI